MRYSSLLLIFFLALGISCQRKSENTKDRPPSFVQSAPVQSVVKKTGTTMKRLDIPCFVYHRFGESKYPSTNISMAVFRQQLHFLKSNNYRVLTLGDAIDLLKEKSSISEKIAIISVDDGYQSFLTGAMPLLREFGYQATLFINTQTVGSPAYMDWDALNKIKEEGIEIGNHSHSHAFFLNNQGEGMREIFTKDVQKAQKLIKENLDLTCDLFAYPYGEFNPVMKAVVQSLGFRAAAAQNSGVIYSGTDLFAIPRFPMGGSYATLEGFKEKVAMKALATELVLPVNRLVFDHKRPTLQISITDDAVDLSRVNCFVQGKKSCTLTRENNKFTVQSKTPLNRRRSLYTITAPAKDNSSWYWYSYVWIQPDVRQ